MASNRQLLADGLAKRADLVKIRLDSIHVEPDFNIPETPEEFNARVDGIVEHLSAGGKVPPIEVRDRADGGVFIVDGHARVEAYNRAAARGLPIKDPKDGHVYILTTPFFGNDVDRIARSYTSAKGRRLSPLQGANRAKKLRNLGLTAAQIAKEFSLSVEMVNQMLALGDSNSDVQQLVQSGEVSAKVASQAARRHGEGAGEVLKQQLDVAKKAGKKKLTESVVSPRVRASELDVERARLDYLMDHRCIVSTGGKMDLNTGKAVRGSWLTYPDDDATQQGVFETGRLAIDAAIAAEKAV